MCGSRRSLVLYSRVGRVALTLIRLPSTRATTGGFEEVSTVLEFFRKFMDASRPDVLLTYGHDPITLGIIPLAKRVDVPVVFAVHVFGYQGVDAFRHVDYCTVPSHFARRHYWHTLGLARQTLSNPLNWARAKVRHHDRKFLTFINPCLEKGVYPFARIAAELVRRRPDIPLLVVESRGTRSTLASCGIDPHALSNIQFIPNTPDPRRFWSQTRVCLMPSLWWENQPMVAIEAMVNGIPVIGSDRGGIPETLGDSGVVLRLPDRLTEESRLLPSADEVGHWVEAVVRLWDDESFYRGQSAKARAESERWHPDRLRPLYSEFFSNVEPQPGPPFVPKPANPEGRPQAGARRDSQKEPWQ
jgi:glycosyltransferase involved in cell wall biosynthesis